MLSSLITFSMDAAQAFPALALQHSFNDWLQEFLSALTAVPVLMVQQE